VGAIAHGCRYYSYKRFSFENGVDMYYKLVLVLGGIYHRCGFGVCDRCTLHIGVVVMYIGYLSFRQIKACQSLCSGKISRKETRFVMGESVH